MLDLEDRIPLLARLCREWAADLRPYALELDRDPGLIVGLTGLEAVAEAARLQIPPGYGAEPVSRGAHRFHLTTALERAVFCEEMARGDLGTLLALPGGSMSAALVDVAADPAQKEWFYGRLSEHPMWTFFALTEPTGGSDAGAMRTAAVRRPDGGLVVSGAKRYVGNAARAGLGTLFFRTGRGPLGIGAALVETSAPGFHAEPIDTIGLRGAQLGAIVLDAVEVPPERVLGRHLPPTRRGMWAWLRTFNLLRPSVAGMGVGVAQAAHDYVRDNRRAASRWDQGRLDAIGRRVESVRRLARAAAAAADRDPGAGHLASAAKVSAAKLAEEVTRSAFDFLGPGARLEHPFLEKLARDARGVEYMEGTGNVQRLAIFNALARGTLEAG